MQLTDYRSKSPHRVLPTVSEGPPQLVAFAPNRETLGGTAYWLATPEGNCLIDCPDWESAAPFLQANGGVRWLVVTHRGGMGQSMKRIQHELGCEIVLQEQEAYLLPRLPLTCFQQEHRLSEALRMLWTPGHSPGSACLYFAGWGGLLFVGRHLLPTPQAPLTLVRSPKTFHWRRQCESLHRLVQEFSPETLAGICPGANIGFLRGAFMIESAHDRLKQAQQLLSAQSLESVHL